MLYVNYFFAAMTSCDQALLTNRSKYLTISSKTKKPRISTRKNDGQAMT